MYSLEYNLRIYPIKNTYCTSYMLASDCSSELVSLPKRDGEPPMMPITWKVSQTLASSWVANRSWFSLKNKLHCCLTGILCWWVHCYLAGLPRSIDSKVLTPPGVPFAFTVSPVIPASRDVTSSMARGFDSWLVMKSRSCCQKGQFISLYLSHSLLINSMNQMRQKWMCKLQNSTEQ